MQIQSTVFSKRTIPNPFPTKRVLAEVVWEECEKCCLLLLLTPLLKALQVLSRTWVSTQTLPSERPFPFRNIPLAPFTWQTLRVQKWVCHNPCSQLLFSTWALVSPRVLGQPVLELTNTPVKRKKSRFPGLNPNLLIQTFWPVKSLSSVRLFVTPWTVAYQAPQSMEFSRQEYWSGLPFPSPGHLPNLGIKPGSPTPLADALPQTF